MRGGRPEAGDSGPELHIVANGKPYELISGTTLAGFIRDRGLDPKFVVVELNGEPLERSRYEALRLSPGDRVELIRAVAGG